MKGGIRGGAEKGMGGKVKGRKGEGGEGGRGEK